MSDVEEETGVGEGETDDVGKDDDEEVVERDGQGVEGGDKSMLIDEDAEEEDGDEVGPDASANESVANAGQHAAHAEILPLRLYS